MDWVGWVFFSMTGVVWGLAVYALSTKDPFLPTPSRFVFFTGWGIVMSCTAKPPEWFGSFDLEACYTLREKNNSVYQFSIMSYALLMYGAVQTISYTKPSTALKRGLQLAGAVQTVSYTKPSTALKRGLQLAGFLALYLIMCVAAAHWVPKLT
jgi:hypothetical protein